MGEINSGSPVSPSNYDTKGREEQKGKFSEKIEGVAKERFTDGENEKGEFVEFSINYDIKKININDVPSYFKKIFTDDDELIEIIDESVKNSRSPDNACKILIEAINHPPKDQLEDHQFFLENLYESLAIFKDRLKGSEPNNLVNLSIAALNQFNRPKQTKFLTTLLIENKIDFSKVTVDKRNSLLELLLERTYSEILSNNPFSKGDPFIKGDDLRKRIALLKSIVEQGGEEVAPILANMMESFKDKKVPKSRKTAIEHLGQLKEKGGQPIEEKIIKPTSSDSPDTEWREKLSGHNYECVEKEPGPNGGWIYGFRLREDFKSADSMEEMNQSIFPAVEYEPESINDRLKYNREFYESLGISYVEDIYSGEITIYFPDKEALQSNWKMKQKDWNELPDLKIITSKGIATDKDFIKALSEYGLLVSDEIEFFHDMCAHAIPYIKLISQMNKEEFEIYEKKKNDLINNLYQLLEIARKADDSGESELKEIHDVAWEHLIGIQIDIFSAMGENENLNMFLNVILDPISFTLVHPEENVLVTNRESFSELLIRYDRHLKNLDLQSPVSKEKFTLEGGGHFAKLIQEVLNEFKRKYKEENRACVKVIESMSSLSEHFKKQLESDTK